MIVRMCRPLVLAASKHHKSSGGLCLHWVDLSLPSGSWLGPLCPPRCRCTYGTRTSTVWADHIYSGGFTLFIFTFDFLPQQLSDKNETFRQRRVRGGPLLLLMGTGSGSAVNGAAVPVGTAAALLACVCQRLSDTVRRVCSGCVFTRVHPQLVISLHLKRVWPHPDFCSE